MHWNLGTLNHESGISLLVEFPRSEESSLSHACESRQLMYTQLEQRINKKKAIEGCGEPDQSCTIIPVKWQQWVFRCLSDVHTHVVSMPTTGVLVVVRNCGDQRLTRRPLECNSVSEGPMSCRMYHKYCFSLSLRDMSKVLVHVQ